MFSNKANFSSPQNLDSLEQAKHIYPSHVYYNFNIVNNTSAPIPATFSETREQPIVAIPALYHLSVVRFRCPTSLIPIFNFIPNAYYVTVGWIDASNVLHTFQQAVLYTPYDNNGTFNVYSYDHMLEMINTAFTAATAAMAAAYPGAAPSVAPYIIFNPVTQLFSLIADIDWQTKAAPLNATIYLNTNLAKLFSFLYHLVGFSSSSQQNFQVIVYNSNANTPPAGTYQMDCDYPTTTSWYDAVALEFLSGSLPIIPEFIPGYGNSRNLLTDFNLDVSNAVANQYPYIEYSPTAEYRLIELNSSTEIRTIDLQVYWRDKQGNPNPLMIGPGDSLTCKLLFRRKEC